MHENKGMKAILTTVNSGHVGTIEVVGKTRKEVAGKVQEEIKKARSASYSIFLKNGISPRFEECVLED